MTAPEVPASRRPDPGAGVGDPAADATATDLAPTANPTATTRTPSRRPPSPKPRALRSVTPHRPTNPRSVTPDRPPNPPRPNNRSPRAGAPAKVHRSEEHTSELQSRGHLVCRLL